MGNRRLKSEKLIKLFFERKVALSGVLATTKEVKLLDHIPIALPADTSISLVNNNKIKLWSSKENKSSGFPEFETNIPREFKLEIYKEHKSNLNILELNSINEGFAAIFIHLDTKYNDSDGILKKRGLQFLTSLNQKLTSSSNGVSISLKLVGTGYRGYIENNNICLRLGYSHEHKVLLPKDIRAEFETPDKIVLFGFDKLILNQFAASIKQIRPINVYSGSGVYYENENVRRKVGKKKN